MTTRLYVGDPYRSKFSAKVLDVADGSLVLDQSCFYGPGGLLPADVGWIAGRRVLGLRRSTTGVLTHVMKPARPSDPAPPRVGDRVRCCIDWQDRYRSMRLHTAQHLVELGARQTNDLVASYWPRVGRFSATVDLVFRSCRFDADAIVDWVTGVVVDDLSMGVTDSPAPPRGRLWYLDGVGHRRCESLHLRSTGELGAVHVDAHPLEPARLRVDLTVSDERGAFVGDPR